MVVNVVRLQSFVSEIGRSILPITMNLRGHASLGTILRSQTATLPGEEFQ
jgi:hypothetical protein